MLNALPNLKGEVNKKVIRWFKIMPFLQLTVVVVQQM